MGLYPILGLMCSFLIIHTEGNIMEKHTEEICRKYLPKFLHPSRVVSVPMNTKGICESSVLHTEFVEGMKAYHVFEDNFKYCCLDQKWVCSENNSNRTSELITPLRKCETKQDCQAISGICLSGYCCELITETLQCPFDNSAPSSSCFSDDDCAEFNGQKNSCLKLKKVNKKYCCAIPKEEYCEGILPPYTNPDGGLLWNKRCDETVAYTLKQDESFVCCRKPFERNLFIETALVSPVINLYDKLPQPCNSSAQCNVDEYCAKSVYFSSYSDPTRYLNATWKFCYKKPTCGGEVLMKNDEEPLTCSRDDICGAGGYCDIDVRHNGYVSKEGHLVASLCCRYTCPEITKDEEYAIAVKTPQPRTKNAVLKSIDARGEICRFPRRPDGKESRIKVCCHYHYKDRVCPKEWNSYDKNVRNQFIPCSQHSDCNLYNVSSGVLCYKKQGYLFGVCCTLELCEDGFTIPAIEPKCTSPADCGQKSVGSAVCHPLHKRCCPRVSRGIIEHTYKTNTKCQVTTDCGYGLRYCEDGYCWLLGERDVRSVTKQTCFDQVDCFGAFIMGVCVIERAGHVGQCYSHPFQTKFNNFKNVNPILKWFGIVCGLFSIIFGLISVIFYLKYRSRHFFDSKANSRYPDKRRSASTKNQNESSRSANSSFESARSKK